MMNDLFYGRDNSQHSMLAKIDNWVIIFQQFDQ